MRKNITLSLLLLLSCCMMLSAKGYKATYTQPDNNSYQIAFSINDWKIQEVVLNGVKFNQIIFDNSTVTEKKGWAELPFVSASIQLPAQKNVDLSIVKSEYKDYVLTYPLVPSRGVIYRNQDPNSIPYTIDPSSISDEFYPSNLATADEPYIIRDVRGTSVRVFPFQYNSKTNTLRVYTSVEVRLSENSDIPTNPLLKENKKPVKEMIGMYQSLFLNFDKSRYDLTMAQYGDMLVITTARDTAAIRPYIEWKREKGFNVSEEVVATGTNVKNLIQQSYNNNNNLLYVQIVGDWADVKVDNSIDGEPVDPKMGCVVGTDNFIDISVGRFSCNNSNQLMVQVNKVINYEKNPDMTTGWRDAFAGIGSDQGPGDDSEYDYVHIQRINSERLQPKLNYTTHYENYGANPSASQLAQYINQGVSTIAYCGHGSETSWVTTGFSNSNISSLTNGAKLPFIVSVACNNGTYDGSGDCFAEAWLKKENGGAIVTWMSSISQPWDPPMRGEDYFYDILGGGFDYSQYQGQSGINTTEQRTTWGSIVVNAACLMLTESQTSSDIETAHTWCTFGDGSIQLRTKMPVEVTASNEIMLIGVPFTTTITSADGPVENALVCISKDGQYESAITDSTGTVTIVNDFLPGEVTLTVTGFNTTTINKTINCIAPEGPYLLFNGYTLAGDSIATYGSTRNLNIAVRNVGVDDAANATVAITTEDPYITFDVASGTFNNIPANDTVILNNAFTFTVAGNVPDNHKAECLLTMACNGEQWTAPLNLTLYAPNVQLVSFGIEGELLPGKTLNITTTLNNTGSCPAYNCAATYTQTSPYVTVVTTSPVNIGTINNHGETVTASFTITVSEDAPFGTIIPSTVTLTGDNNFNYAAEFQPFIDICNVALNVFPYNEGYEDSELPNCWTQETISGTGNWSTKNGGLNNHPYHAHTGSYNAYISGDSTVVKLVSPLINFSNVTDPVLKFWHAQSVNNSKQDKLRVYYKNTTDGEWTLLAEYPYSIATWKQREIALPNPTSNYYIAFEAECNGGFGVVIDDVNITATMTTLLGDVNGDGNVDIMDIMSMVSYLTGGNPTPFIMGNADINADGAINVLDVMAVVNIIANR